MHACLYINIVMFLASNVITLMLLTSTVYCLHRYKYASSINLLGALYYINIYTLRACLGMAYACLDS